MAASGENPVQNQIAADAAGAQPMADGQGLSYYSIAAEGMYGLPSGVLSYAPGGAFASSDSLPALSVGSGVPGSLSPFLTSDDSKDAQTASNGLPQLAFMADSGSSIPSTTTAAPSSDFSNLTIGPREKSGGASAPGDSTVLKPTESTITSDPTPAAPKPVENPIPSSVAGDDPLANIVRDKATELKITEATNSQFANIKIYADGRSTEVDMDQIQKDGNECKVWIEDGAKGNLEKINSALETVKQELSKKGITKTIPATLPAFLTNQPAVNPIQPDSGPTPDAGPDHGPNPGPCPGPEPGPGPSPGPGPGPSPEVNPEVTPEVKPDTNKLVGQGPEKLNKIADMLSGKTTVNGQSLNINPYTHTNFMNRLMPANLASRVRAVRFQDLDGDGKISEEERNAALKDLEDYLASDEGKKDLAEFEKNATEASQTLSNDSVKDASANEITGLVDKFRNPTQNREFISDLAVALNKSDASTLTPEDMQAIDYKGAKTTPLISEGLQRAIIKIATLDAIKSANSQLDLINPTINPEAEAKATGDLINWLHQYEYFRSK